MAGRVLEALQHRRMTLGPAGREQGDGKAQGFRHWQLAWDDSGTAWLLLNRQGSSVNTLNAETFDELSDILNNLTEEPPAALVIRSAKPTGFCAGADVGEFANLDRKEPVQEALDRAHAVLDRLEGLAFPTIAVIHGDCLGAGLELALACDFRIAIDGAKLGFPEVRLGLHPGLGGTVRLTGLIDPTEAMTLMLTGKSAHTAKAADLGLVDAVTQERHVRNGVRAAAAGELKGAKPGLKATALNSLAAREIASRQMRSKAEEKARAEHYPAPFKLIDLWREHGGDSAAMRKAETESFAELVLSETAQNLIRVFFLREGLKREGSAAAEVRHVHVIGAGAMGGDIAGLCAINGLRVSLSDIDRQMIGDAIKRTKTMAEQKHLGPRGLREALDRLVPDRENQGVRYADVVIEAAPEDAELKQDIYRTVEPAMRDEAILATNTSSLPLETLANVLQRPGRFVGMHFFNPVALMQLVEAVSHDAVEEEAFRKAKAFLRRLDKLPAPVRSSPGFLVNRCLMPYLLEALLMLDEGAKPESIDQAAERFGMPMGPVELADQVGLDIALSVADVLQERLSSPLPELPSWFREKVQGGSYGRKSGNGLYAWKNGEAQKNEDPPEPTAEMEDRLMLPLLNACATCLREGVVSDTQTVDAAMIFATGFAPFRGGPMHYAERRGYAEIAGRLEEFRDKFGDRFTPDAYWRERANP